MIENRMKPRSLILLIHLLITSSFSECLLTNEPLVEKRYHIKRDAKESYWGLLADSTRSTIIKGELIRWNEDDVLGAFLLPKNNYSLLLPSTIALNEGEVYSSFVHDEVNYNGQLMTSRNRFDLYRPDSLPFSITYNISPKLSNPYLICNTPEKSQDLYYWEDSIPTLFSHAEMKKFQHNSLWLYWAGDLDRDGKLDIIFWTSGHSWEEYYLLLSSLAKDGELVGRYKCK